MQAKEKSLSYALLRIAIGVNFAGHEFGPFKTGIAQFAANSAGRLTKSPLPHGLVLGFLYTVPVIEGIIGITLILGLGTRFGLVLASVLMIVLTIGATSNQQFDAAGTQLLYSLVLFVLLFLTEYNEFSLDRVLRGRTAHRG